MSFFKNTDNWIQQTTENNAEQLSYDTKRMNNEDISMFNVEKRPRTSNILHLKNKIPKYDHTLEAFIRETSAANVYLRNKVIELEEKIKKLEENNN